jgi:hypothetical protein
MYARQNNCRSLLRYEPPGWSWPLTVVERWNNQKDLPTLIYLLVLTEDLFSKRICLWNQASKLLDESSAHVLRLPRINLRATSQ